MKKYVCVVCGWVYDPEVGDPEGGIAPGTAFEDIPDDWVCPLCERIRHNSDAPIIFITSCDDEESIIKGLDMGGDDYVTKQQQVIDTATLYLRVDTLLYFIPAIR